MGYKAKSDGATTYTLEFVDRDGLEVKVRNGTAGESLEGLGLEWVVNSEVRKARLATRDSAKVEVSRAYTLFLDRVISWNLEEDDGTPIPIEMDALLAQDDNLVADMVNAWLSIVFGVSGPLDKRSTGGETETAKSFEEALIPMDIPSENLAS